MEVPCGLVNLLTCQLVSLLTRPLVNSSPRPLVPCLLVEHVFVVELEDVEQCAPSFDGGAAGVEVGGALVVVEGTSPVGLFAVGVAAQVVGLVFVWEVALQQGVQRVDGFGHLVLPEVFFYQCQLFHTDVSLINQSQR